MNKLTETLLGGSAICALMAAPAVAQSTHPAMHVMALHAGKQVNKTATNHFHAAAHVTYTFGVYTEMPADARKSGLYNTFYRWNDTYSGYLTGCSMPKQYLKVPRRSVYARIDQGTLTYSYGCPSGPYVFYGDVWTNKTGVPGNVDTFRSTLVGHFKGHHGGIVQRYKGTLNLDVQVSITQ